MNRDRSTGEREGGATRQTALDTASLVIPAVFASFDDFWKPSLGGTGPAPSYVGLLEPKQRDELRERLRRRLPAERDGSIRLQARAWAARGTAT